MRLLNKVALITGGTSGIGRATAIMFAQEGAKIVITGRNINRGQDVINTIKETGGEALFIRADVRYLDECRKTVDETIQAYNRLDILFNNAGVWFPNTAVDCTEDEWDLTVDISLKGAYLMSKVSLPIMIAQRSGVVINNGSGWGLIGGPKAVAYCAAKGGLVNLTKAMAIDHGPQGIRINCICPGDTETPLLTKDAREQNIPWADYIAHAADVPLKRIATPEEIAKAVLYLASDDSSFVTGATLVVDGGGIAG